jgi:hypothetical protein
VNDRERYVAAAHAMQTAVLTKRDMTDPDNSTGECSPKHLRVGVNAAMVDCGSLAELLVAKGIITEEERVKALADGMEREVQMYKEWFGQQGFGFLDFA